MALRFALLNGTNPVTTSTDTNGHYTLTLNAGIYYLQYISGTAPAPLGFISPNAIDSGTGMPQYDLTTSDRTQDFQLPTTTLTLTIKDGFGTPVPNAPVSTALNGTIRFPLTPTDPPRYYNATSRNGTTDTAGTATLTIFKATYPAGTICTTVNNNQICNTTSITISNDTSLTLQQLSRPGSSGERTH